MAVSNDTRRVVEKIVNAPSGTRLPMPGFGMSIGVLISKIESEKRS